MKRYKLSSGEVVGIGYFYTKQYTGLDIQALDNLKLHHTYKAGIYSETEVTRVV